MSNTQEHLQILGMKVKDKVTGFSGVATSVSFDLYGCIMVVVNPPLNKDGEKPESSWYDIARLEVTSGRPVMRRPDFVQGAVAEGRKGPADKPTFMKP